MNDSLHSLFLAHALGFFFLIVAIILLAQQKYYRDIFINTKSGSSVVLVASTVGLIFGISLVLMHNIWLWESEVLITIVAWIILLKSLAYLAFPEFMITLAHKIYSGSGYYFVMIVTGLLGVLLLSHGVYLYLSPLNV